MNKQQTRISLISSRNSICELDYISKNLIIKNSLLELIKDYQCIGIYVSKQYEVDTINIINEINLDKTVCVPKVNDQSLDFHIIKSVDELSVGSFNVLEPFNQCLIDVCDIDVMIIPLVGFDASCNRIGYGAGFYDRTLINYQQIKIGLAFSEQQVSELQIEKHDQIMDIIVSDEMIYRRK